MDITFEKGDPQHPKGHALLYFRVSTEPDKVYATYVVTLPVKSDLTKYVPPFLASHLGSLPLSDFSAFAMPPVPEALDSYEELERMSRMRDDDLVFGDSMFSYDLPRMMEAVTEAVQSYAELYANQSGGSVTIGTGTTEAEDGPVLEASGSIPLSGQAPANDEVLDSSYDVNEVLFGLMSERDKLGELSRLLGKLRFAVEGNDSNEAEEVSGEISTLGRHLPENFQVPSLLAVARETTQQASRLAQLYLDRCFRLSDGDTNSAADLDQQIQSIKEGG
ncbi:MAG: hypothetical protein BZY81_03130 [SAR202 cluster bacterium Io17-Chloro-G4]|nr:MAG: hypothetical protein BZY81_03130 [SAR202 cluster bacterium Io17-Chloro-G4]